nr:PREDICTED: astacin-like metalloendopeptidase isoform X2 [Latimeria chalumnae]|eukprot:XP_014352462.1 PREDICTED: astacin-like metalloendopeptidase isoform X2 [Latimeria chalumnae]
MSLQVLLTLVALFCYSLPQTLKEENCKPYDEEEDERENSISGNILEMNKGDIEWLIFGDVVANRTKAAENCPKGHCYWVKGSDGFVTIPYEISDVYTPQQRGEIISALEEMNKMTCVRFIPQTIEKDYLSFISGAGCWSFVGRIKGKQTLSLSNRGCVKRGVIQHEANHAMGMNHEQNRDDRDDFVQIIWENLKEGYESAYIQRNFKTFGLPYDYLSAMHYGRYSFSKARGLPTMVPIPNPDQVIGQQYGFSDMDYRKLKTLYECKVCSTLLPDWAGHFTSANYPSPYPENSNCVWIIRTQRKRVRLNFLKFRVESSKNCSKDYVKVYDGYSNTSLLLLDKTCGRNRPPMLIASANIMMIEFVSDNKISKYGFVATYKTGTCGETLFNMTGGFSSPSYPSNYPRSNDCYWTIIAPKGYTISLEMQDFKLEFSFDCEFDYVSIRDGGNKISPIKGKYCGMQSVPTFNSTESSVLVHFSSDSSGRNKGFLATYVMRQNTWTGA